MLVKGGATSLGRFIFAWIYFRDCKFWYSTRRYIFIDLVHLFFILRLPNMYHLHSRIVSRFHELKHIN